MKRDLNAIFVAGPGHGGPAVVANTYLEGTYSELYPNISRDVAGMARLFEQFSFPGGIPSHAAPQTPGSIHEGGELGYALSHAFGAAFDNPELVVACAIGDGEAETGPLATSWHSNKFLNPVRDGAVLPIFHLNGWKIAELSVLARIPHDELVALLNGYGWDPRFVEGDQPALVHQAFAAALDDCLDTIASIQRDARRHGFTQRPRWPMIVLKTPKGWTGPKFVDGLPVEGTFRAHQVPLGEVRTNPEHLAMLESWMRSYRPERLFAESGALRTKLQLLAPTGTRRMGANPIANGGSILQELRLRDYSNYAVDVSVLGAADVESTRVAGEFLRDVIRDNPTTFRIVGPDETASNRLDAVFEVTDRVFTGEWSPLDEHVSPDGRVMEVLSEHQCEGWLEGYLVTGRHGFFSCYEAFVHIIDSMFNQHAKWLETSRKIPWRRPIASLNLLLSSHVWRQDHNGFSHQDPGFIDVVLNKKPEVVRAYFPPDANTLLSTVDHCLRSRDYVNVIVAGKQPAPQWLNIDAAKRHTAPVRKLVSAHLGGGASLCAIDGKRSIDTTMGFTPLDGLIMATRSGSLDPGLLLAYMRRYGLSVDAAEDLLTNRSGLLGLSGSADMREILAQGARGDKRAVLAFDAFVYRVAGAVGAMSAALGGLDAIAFLGGIGENSAEVRAGACAPFAFLGADIDTVRNATPSGDAVVSSEDARVTVLRIHAREDWMMALAGLTVA